MTPIDPFIIGALAAFGVPMILLSCGVWTVLQFGKVISLSATLITD